MTKDELGLERKGARQTVFGNDGGTGEIAIVLEVGAVSLELDGGPGVDLGNGASVLRPGWEAVGISWNVALELIDYGIIFKEQNGAVSRLDRQRNRGNVRRPVGERQRER